MKSIKTTTIAYIKQIISYIKRPLNIFDIWAAMGRLNWMPDKWYLSLKFRSRMGYWMNWKHPETFNEKLQWYKIHNRNPLYTILVDKYEVRAYIADKIGKEYLIPLLGVWNSFDEIDFNQLPNQFVLKCSHDSGSVFICKDKKKFDTIEVKQKINQSLSHNFFYNSREWPYKNIKPKIVAEKYMEDENGELRDYKFFCFNGVPKLFLLYKGRYKKKCMTIDFFDEDGKWLNITHPEYGRSLKKPQLPQCFNKLKSLAQTLSKSIPFVRTDFYVIKNKIFFGEMTFFPTAGFASYKPNEMDKQMGDWLRISINSKANSQPYIFLK